MFGNNDFGNTIAYIATLLRRLWFGYHAFQGYKKLFSGRWYEIRLSQWIAMIWLTIFWGAVIIGLFVVGGTQALPFIWVPIVGYLLWRLYVVFEAARIRAAIRHGGEAYRPEDSLVERVTGSDRYNRPPTGTGYRRLQPWERTESGRRNHEFDERMARLSRESDIRNNVPEYLRNGGNGEDRSYIGR